MSQPALRPEQLRPAALVEELARMAEEATISADRQQDESLRRYFRGYSAACGDLRRMLIERFGLPL